MRRRRTESTHSVIGIPGTVPRDEPPTRVPDGLNGDAAPPQGESAQTSRGNMSAIITWLEKNAYGFSELTEAERQAISDFSLLWSLFEAHKLNSAGTAASVRTFATQLLAEGYDVHLLDEQLAYFRNRYFADGAETHHFEHLNLRTSDSPAIVRQVLSGASSAPEDVLLTLLVVVFRFRNNLFHGLKWAYGIQSQYDNFTHACVVLTRMLEVACPTSSDM